MTATVAITFCLVIAFVALCLLVTNVSLADRVSGPMREFARELDGQYFPGRESHRISFLDQNVRFRFSTTHIQRQKQTLKLSAQWPDPKFRARLFPEVLSDDVKRFIGMQDIKIGAKAIDDAFVIQSNNEDQLIRLLTPEAQLAILEAGDIHLTISDGTFAIHWQGHVQSRYLLMKAVRRSLSAYHSFHITNPRADGIEMTFVETDQATCMVCGESMTEQIVSCLRCKTLHHRDCWEYLGICSTYACGSNRSKNR